MNKKPESNFMKAMNDLLNFDEDNSSKADGTEQGEKLPEKEFEKILEAAQERVFASQPTDSLNRAPQSAGRPLQEPLQRESEESPIMPAMPPQELPRSEAVITEDVIIDGNITAKANLRISGRIHGNVISEGSIVLFGSIEGDVAAKDLKMQTGSITGNIAVKEDVTVDAGANVKGDVSAARGVFNGHLEGNLMISEGLELREASMVVGNISANTVSMYNGSKVKGMIDIGG